MSAIVGIDISKATFDCVLLLKGESTYQSFANTPQGLDDLHGWLAVHNVDTAHVAMEQQDAMGMRSLSICIVPGLSSARSIHATSKPLLKVWVNITKQTSKMHI